MEFPENASMKLPEGYYTLLEAIVDNSPPKEANPSKSNNKRKEASAHELSKCFG